MAIGDYWIVMSNFSENVFKIKYFLQKRTLRNSLQNKWIFYNAKIKNFIL